MLLWGIFETIGLNIEFSGDFGIGCNGHCGEMCFCFIGLWLRRILRNETVRYKDTHLLIMLLYNPALVLYSASFLVHYGTLRAAGLLHNELLVRVLRLPQKFFDTTPLGRIVSRFSGDVNTLDNQLASHIRSALLTFHRVILHFKHNQSHRIVEKSCLKCKLKRRITKTVAI